MKFTVDIEILLPLIDLWLSLIFKTIAGVHMIDQEAYIEQSKIYMTGSADYAKLVGNTGPI